MVAFKRIHFHQIRLSHSNWAIDVRCGFLSSIIFLTFDKGTKPNLFQSKNHPMKHDIVTITVNPSLDKNTIFSGLVADQKLRCSAPTYDAGGGGVNVSKALARLGTSSFCIFTSGGSSGKKLEELLEGEEIERMPIAVKSWTRENLIAMDENTKKQYRFGFPGNSLSTSELQKIITAVKNICPKYIVASGSLPEQTPDDFYVEIARECQKNNARFVLDTSGDALKQTLEAGVFLAKPNIGELAKLVGVETLEADEADDAARLLIDKGQADMFAISLGSQGAVLVTKDETIYVSAPSVSVKSTVGAGDSMVAGIVNALSHGLSNKEAIQWGVACGSAATMNSGTQLFKKEDAERLFQKIQRVRKWF